MFVIPDSLVTQLPLALQWDQNGIIAKLILGLIIGVIAKLLMPGKDPGGCIITSIIGIVGAGIGGVLGRLLFGDSNYTPGWIMAIVGAMLLLFIYRLIVGKKV